MSLAGSATPVIVPGTEPADLAGSASIDMFCLAPDLLDLLDLRAAALGCPNPL
jgi:hypothetical protein